MIYLERAAEELKKSRVFWLRMLAVLSVIILFKLGSMNATEWKDVARGMRTNVVSHAGGHFTTTGDDSAMQPVDVSGDFIDNSAPVAAAKPAVEEDGDIKIAKRKRDKRTADRNTDKFCKSLIKEPAPFAKDCRRIGNNMTCLNGRNVMFSQFGQDYYLFTEHFRKLTRTGAYLDVAANDAIGISNSYFFDRCLGWRGVCIEGNPYYYERLFRLRTCTLVPTCVANHDGASVKFGLAGGAGGIMDDQNKHMKVWAKQKMEVHTIKERCTTLDKVMDREQMFEIDYMSLDVEGHELQVLQGIDWSRTKINVLTIEVSRHTAADIEAYMLGLNYKRHKATYSDRNDVIGSDVVYLHENVIWGSPV